MSRYFDTGLRDGFEDSDSIDEPVDSWEDAPDKNPGWLGVLIAAVTFVVVGVLAYFLIP